MEYNQYNNNMPNNQYDNMSNTHIGMGNGNNISMNNMPDMNNIPTNKKHKKKKRGGCLLGIIKFFLFIALILLAIFGYRVYKKNKEWNKLVDELVLIDTEEYYKDKLDVPSDIEGLTIREKISKGMVPYKDSDTDNDGLTDKEEIEVYHTDPLKASSSGDSIPDGYKVLNNMDLNKKYELSDIKDSYLFESVEGINLKDMRAENALCNISETDIKLYGNNVERAIRIDDYLGEIEVDFSKYVDNDKDYVLFTLYDGVRAEVEEVKLKNGKAIIGIKESGVIIGLIKKASFNASVADEETSFISGNQAVFMISPLAYILGQREIIIVEKSLIDHGDTDRSTELTKKLSDYLGIGVNVTHRYSNGLEFEVLTKIMSYMMTPQYFKDINKKMGSSDMSDENAQGASNMLKLFFTYGELNKGKWIDLLKIGNDLKKEETSEEVEDDTPKKPDKYISSFTRKDIFPFKNLSTYISPGGNCAGISEVTTQVFNGVFFEKEGSGNYIGKDLSYKITDSEMDTLFDKYLYDYKYDTYWKDTYENLLDRNALSEKDQEFIDFIGYKWARSNELYQDKIRMWELTYDWSQMEELMDYFASGDKICTVYLHGNIVHAINAYGVEQDKYDKDIYRILIYDNNFPDGTWGDDVIDEYIEVRKVTKKNWKGEKVEKFSYDYVPLKNKKGKHYRVTNKLHLYSAGGAFQNTLGTLFQCESIDFFDENGELINKSRDK